MNVLRVKSKFLVATEMIQELSDETYDRHDFATILKGYCLNSNNSAKVDCIHRDVAYVPYFSGYDIVFERKDPVPITITKECDNVLEWQSLEEIQNHIALRNQRIQEEL